MIIGVASADHLRADRSPDGLEHWGGAGWARIGQYLPFYRAAGHTVVCGVMWKQSDGLYVEDAEGTHTRPDVLIMQRLMLEGVPSAIRWGQKHGQIIVNDVDDFYWGLDTANAAYYHSHPKLRGHENTDHYMKVIEASDLLTVSTSYLRQRLSTMCSTPLETVPNYIDVNRFTPVVQHEHPTLGWVGSTEHRSRDIETLRGIVPPFVHRGEYKLHHGGASWVEEGVLLPTFAEKIDIAPELVSLTKRAMAEDYPSLMTEFDVGLVPLNDVPFNRAKSNIKGLEYAASGIPFIAQGLPEYQSLFNAWGDGFIVAKRPKDWIKGLKRMLDYEYRLDMQAQCLDKVKAHDIVYGAHTWIELIEGL